MNTRIPVHLFILFILLVQIASLSLPAQAASAKPMATASTYTVDVFSDSDDINPGNNVCADSTGHCSLRAALMEANAHAGEDTISLPAGTHFTTQILRVEDDVIVTGAGKTTSIIYGSSATYGFYVDTPNDDLDLRYLGIANYDRAIWLDYDAGNAQLELYDVTVHDNEILAESGAAIRNSCTGCTVNISQGYIYNNSASYCGAISNVGTFNIYFSHIYDNDATTLRGGALCNYGGSFTLSHSYVHGNQAMSGGSSDYGGGIVLDGGSLTIDQTQVYQNIAADKGGGIYVVEGALSITSSEIIDNLSPEGGGVYLYGGTTQITDTEITDTTATSGGGIYSEAPLLIDHSLVMRNSATDGAGIYSTEAMTVTNSSVISNTATGSGGGFYIFNPANLSNLTISGNTAEENGAGIYTIAGSTVWLANVTISNNIADYDDNENGKGGGVYQSSASSTLYFKNSIIAGNEDYAGNLEPYAPDCFGTLTSEGYNLVGLDNAACDLTGNLTGLQTRTFTPALDAHLGALTQFDELAYYHPLLLGPAVDRGNPAGCIGYGGISLILDQLGHVRPFGSASPTYTPRCDLGAIESSITLFNLFLVLIRR